MPDYERHNRDLHDDSRKHMWDGLWQRSPSSPDQPGAEGSEPHAQDFGGFSGGSQGLEQIGFPEAPSAPASGSHSEPDAIAPLPQYVGSGESTSAHFGLPDAGTPASGGSVEPLGLNQPAPGGMAPGQPSPIQSAGAPAAPAPSGPGPAAPAAPQQVADATTQDEHQLDPMNLDTSGPILFDGEAPGGLLGMFGEVLENAMEIVSSLIDLVQAQIQNFFEGLEGAVDAVMSFATTFSFNYWDGDSIESVSFTANAVAAYDAETGDGEYAATVSFAGAGAVEGEDGGIDSYGVSIGYAEAGAFGTDEDGLFEATNSSVLSIGAAVENDEEGLSFLHNESSSSTVSLPAEQSGGLDGIGLASEDDDSLTAQELAEGLSMAEANSQAGTSLTMGNDSVDASAGATGIGMNLEYDSNGALIDSGIAGVESSVEVHIDDLDALFGDSDAGLDQSQPGSGSSYPSQPGSQEVPIGV